MKCPKCGALVGKKQKHKKWHKRTERLDWTGPMGPQGPAGPMGMSGRDAPGAVTGNVHYDTEAEFLKARDTGTDEDKDKLYQHMAANDEKRNYGDEIDRLYQLIKKDS